MVQPVGMEQEQSARGAGAKLRQRQRQRTCPIVKQAGLELHGVCSFDAHALLIPCSFPLDIHTPKPTSE